MLDNIYLKFINSLLIHIYRKNVKKYGFTPRGLFWNSKESQENRFAILLKLLIKYSKKIDKNEIRIADIGCGFGDFNSFLSENFHKEFSYKGYDINSDFVNYCKTLNKAHKDFFFVSDYPLETCDFSIMNGTYNYAIYKNISRWEKYLIHNLEKCIKNTKVGIIFNLQHAKSTKIVNSIFYTSRFSMEEKLRKVFNVVSSFYFNSTPNDVYYVILNS